VAYPVKSAAEICDPGIDMNGVLRVPANRGNRDMTLTGRKGGANWSRQCTRSPGVD
jgi:hypothetical protein